MSEIYQVHEIVKEIKVKCHGRTGPMRPGAFARLEYMNDGSVRIRVDDLKNPEFWLEFTVPPFQENDQ